MFTVTLRKRQENIDQVQGWLSYSSQEEIAGGNVPWEQSIVVTSSLKMLCQKSCWSLLVVEQSAWDACFCNLVIAPLKEF